MWEEYLNGNTAAFINVLSQRLTKRQIATIRKAFDDNAPFHNAVINYLFLMDVLIKEIAAAEGLSHNELINFAVNASLDKIYFVLIKTLNNAE